MLHVLTHNILPVFAVLALGFLMGRAGRASGEEARAANRLAFMVFQPALIFPLIAGIDFGQFDALVLGLYALSEIVTFAVAYILARHLLGREHLESFLLAMAVVFVNSLLYIWPISYLIYGEAAALPITAIVTWDASVAFGFFIISMELMAGDKGAGGAIRRIATNPVLLAILLGAACNVAGLAIPEPVLTAAEFAGAAAAPLTLFALGVILSASPLALNPTVAAITGMKLIFFPALVASLLWLITPGNAWTPQFVLNAAGPSGMMAFALALLYNVRTDAIAPVIIWTSALSVFSLAVLA